MNTLLANAVASITLGIEDYRSDGKHRSLSALRNISAGLLLLFKEKLVRLAPDETLIKADFHLLWTNGAASWSAKGDKTIDYRGIKDRFKLVGIKFDFTEMDNIVSQRNRIEHYLADISKAQLRSSIANAVTVVSRFCREHLGTEPGELLGEELWTELIKEKRVHQAQREESLARLNRIIWPHERMKQLVADRYFCPFCGADVCLPIDPTAPLRQQRFACAGCGRQDGYDVVMKAVFTEWATNGNHLAAMDGGEAVSEECERCGEDAVFVDNGYCVLCGADHYKTCPGCKQTIHVNHYCEYCDAMASMKPDDVSGKAA